MRVEVPISDECAGLSDRVMCSGGTALTCRDQRVSEREDCDGQGRLCAVGVGCRVCEPNATRCDGNQRYRCNGAGDAEVALELCVAPESCSPSGCLDLCRDALENRSYLGCDYWPVFTSNSLLPSPFRPAVSIGNGNLVPAHVVISHQGKTVSELDLSPRSATTVDLRYTPELKSPAGSALIRRGAYHLTASVPVTVHQFNPLLYELPADCEGEEPPGASGDGRCNSYSNDASLLLPASALTPAEEQDEVSFLAMSRAPFMTRTLKGDGSGSYEPSYQGRPGFVAITAVGSAPVHVRFQTTAYTAASAPEGEPIPALAPGETLERELEPGDVLQLVSQLAQDCTGTVAEPSDELPSYYCDLGPTYDLTGSEIRADGPIQVISGHDCSNVPFDRVACDHLEESIPPTATWGTSVVVKVPRSSAGAHSLIRVLSSADDNTVTFDPPVREPVLLQRGQVIEVQAAESVHIVGSQRLMVGQFLVGQSSTARVGDPSLTIAVPTGQYRARYNFISPATYEQNVVDIIAVTGDEVSVDGELVTGWTQVGQSRYSVASVPLSQPGAHEARGKSGFGFGIVLYGLGSFTSYMLPGGLDLTPLEIGI